MKCPKCGAPLGVVGFGSFKRVIEEMVQADTGDYRACVRCGTIYKIKFEEVKPK